MSRPPYAHSAYPYRALWLSLAACALLLACGAPPERRPSKEEIRERLRSGERAQTAGLTSRPSKPPARGAQGGGAGDTAKGNKGVGKGGDKGGDKGGGKSGGKGGGKAGVERKAPRSAVDARSASAKPLRALTAAERDAWCATIDPLVARFVEALVARGSLSVDEVLSALSLTLEEGKRFFGLLGSCARWSRFDGDQVQPPWRRDGDTYSLVTPKAP